VRTGVLHTEIKLTTAGPRIIEINGRVGGGGIDTIFTRRHGIPLTALAARAALGLPVRGPSDSPAGSSGPFVYEFFVQPPRRATRLVSMESADGLIGVAGAETVIAHHAPGDPVDLREGSQGYVLRVGGTAADRDALAAVPAAITASAGLEYEYV
jgi:hypothetical protein